MLNGYFLSLFRYRTKIMENYISKGAYKIEILTTADEVTEVPTIRYARQTWEYSVKC